MPLFFKKYPLLRFSWVLKIETVLVEVSDQPARGGCEPAIICMGAVIANAIHDVTGVRLFQLPIIPERIKQALA